MIPSSKEDLAKLQKIADENEKAGTWLYSGGGLDPIPTKVGKPSPSDLVPKKP